MQPLRRCDVNQLQKVQEQGNPYLILPTRSCRPTLVEWVCPMCLEDSLRLQEGGVVDQGALFRGSLER